MKFLFLFIVALIATVNTQKFGGDSDKPPIAAKPVNSEKNERFERSEYPEKNNRFEKSEKPEKFENFERNEKSVKPEKNERFDKFEYPEKNERFEKPEKQEKFEKFERSGKDDSKVIFINNDRPQPEKSDPKVIVIKEDRSPDFHPRYINRPSNSQLERVIKIVDARDKPKSLTDLNKRLDRLDKRLDSLRENRKRSYEKRPRVFHERPEQPPKEPHVIVVKVDQDKKGKSKSCKRPEHRAYSRDHRESSEKQFIKKRYQHDDLRRELSICPPKQCKGNQVPLDAPLCYCGCGNVDARSDCMKESMDFHWDDVKCTCKAKLCFWEQLHRGIFRFWRNLCNFFFPKVVA